MWVETESSERGVHNNILHMWIKLSVTNIVSRMNIITPTYIYSHVEILIA